MPPSGHLRTIGRTDEREASGPILSVGSLNTPCLPASVVVVGLPVGVLEASPIEKVSPMAVGVLEAPPREADRRVRSEVGEPEARSLPVGGRHRVVALVQSE